jgi:dihydrofolate synthase/folylpolyglutamate synthase
VAFASLAAGLSWLDAHIDYERVAPTRRALPSLDGMRQALALLGDPQTAFSSLHITGTNGKGSTTAMATALLVESGLSVGSYTSPNLHRVNERIAWNAEPVDDATLLDLLERLRMIEPLLAEPLTRFELLTVAAFLHFADVAVDVAVVEVGLGGTWDSTNVLDAPVAVLTSIGLDHTQVLGDTEVEIAADKAGIIAPGSTAILGPTTDQVAEVVERRCDEVGAAGLWRYGIELACTSDRLAVGGRLVDLAVPGAAYHDVLIPLHGRHQGQNAAVALAAVAAFLGRAPSPEVVEVALGSVVVPGRLEVLGSQPLIVVDGAHNPAGAEALSSALAEGFSVEGHKVAVLGMLEGRDPCGILRPLLDAGIDQVICVAPETPRAMDAAKVAAAAGGLGLDAIVASSIVEGVHAGLSKVSEGGLLLVTGSLYVVGEARAELLAHLGRAG